MGSKWWWQVWKFSTIQCIMIAAIQIQLLALYVQSVLTTYQTQFLFLQRQNWNSDLTQTHLWQAVLHENLSTWKICQFNILPQQWVRLGAPCQYYSPFDNHMSDTPVTGIDGACVAAANISANGLALSCSKSSDAFVDWGHNLNAKIYSNKHSKCLAFYNKKM
jgi:hypothetical protein